jgi:hypothetical protein
MVKVTVEMPAVNKKENDPDLPAYLLHKGYGLQNVTILPSTATCSRLPGDVGLQFLHALKLGNRGDVNRPIFKMKGFGRWEGDKGGQVRAMVSMHFTLTVLTNVDHRLFLVGQSREPKINTPRQRQ